jgi:hypothetical protein
VISTRSSVVVPCAKAGAPTLSITPPQATINAVQSRVFFMSYSGARGRSIDRPASAHWAERTSRRRAAIVWTG